MKNIVLLLILTSICFYINAQNHPFVPINGTPDLLNGFRPLSDKEISEIPELNIQINKRSQLPYRLDNSKNKYFRGIVIQQHGSCSQTSGISYIYTYEINFLRDLNSKDSANQYPSHFTYNFLNGGSGDNGSNYTDGWQIVKEIGCPNVIDYGGGLVTMEDVGWLSGYDKYYNGMHNRTIEYFKIKIDTEEGLQELKQWLFDHGEGTSVGGLANFSAGIANATSKIIKPFNGYEGKKRIIESWSDPVDHAMTFVGWDDSVRYDFNGDGKFTNDIDQNNDGIIDMKDWEIGALIVANTWGYNWGGGDSGLVYCPYRLLSYSPKEGGISNGQVYVVKAQKEYEPKLTAKVVLKHEKRKRISISVGISEYTQSLEPDFEITFKAFNKKGGDLPINGFTNDSIEIGLDISPLINQKEIEANKFFLRIKEEDEDTSATGTVFYFSIIDYQNNANEIISKDQNIEILNNDITTLTINPNYILQSPDLYEPITISDTSAILYWNIPSNNQTVNHYNVYRNNIFITEVSDTFLKLENQPNGTKYKVRASYNNGFSAPSNTVYIKGLKRFPIPASGFALNFDGLNDYIDCGKNFNLKNHDFSVEFWAKRSPDDANQFVVGHGRINKTDQGLHIGFRNNKLMCGFWGDDVHTDEAYYDENWHHYAITYDTATKTQLIYRDGEIAGERTAKSNYKGEGTLYIGCMNGDRWMYHGELDEIKIWEKTLTQQEINQYMYKPVDLSDVGLLAYYNFDEKVGYEISDNSAKQDDALLKNMNNAAWNKSLAWEKRSLSNQISSIDLFAGYSVDSNFLKIDILKHPNHGDLSLDNNIFQYQLQNDFHGYDSFSYTISEGNLVDSFTYYIKGTLVTNNIFNQDKQSNYIIYPQPARDWISIEFDVDLNNMVDLKLYNIDGKLVVDQTLFISSKIDILFDPLKIPKGLYFLKILYKDENILSEQILIQ